MRDTTGKILRQPHPGRGARTTYCCPDGRPGAFDEGLFDGIPGADGGLVVGIPGAEGEVVVGIPGALGGLVVDRPGAEGGLVEDMPGADGLVGAPFTCAKATP